MTIEIKQKRKGCGREMLVRFEGREGQSVTAYCGCMNIYCSDCNLEHLNSLKEQDHKHTKKVVATNKRLLAKKAKADKLIKDLGL